MTLAKKLLEFNPFFGDLNSTVCTAVFYIANPVVQKSPLFGRQATGDKWSSRWLPEHQKSSSRDIRFFLRKSVFFVRYFFLFIKHVNRFRKSFIILKQNEYWQSHLRYKEMFFLSPGADIVVEGTVACGNHQKKENGPRHLPSFGVGYGTN